MQLMRTDNHPEHFVTLFDSLFLPQGMALHSSLVKHAQPFHLWIICMDEKVEQNLRKLNLDNVSLIPISEAETPELLAAKQGRNRGEYCWTVTPFASDFVFERAPTAQRVTYIDADVYLFAPPQTLLQELEHSGKHVLITDHAYDPALDETEGSGRFCVQFMTFRRTPEAQLVSKWWQARCIEWCYDRLEAGRFGDQKYLDDWPTRFRDAVHVLEQTDQTLAPWNARYFAQRNGGTLRPTIYHFQSLRFIGPTKIRLYKGYPIPKAANYLYSEYLSSLANSNRAILGIGEHVPFANESYRGAALVRHWKTCFLGLTKYKSIPSTNPL